MMGFAGPEHSQEALERQVDGLDRLMKSSTVQHMLELMRENIELKSQLRIMETEMELRGARQELERMHQETEQLRRQLAVTHEQNQQREKQEQREQQEQRARVEHRERNEQGELREQNAMRERMQAELQELRQAREKFGVVAKERDAMANKLEAAMAKFKATQADSEARLGSLKQELEHALGGNAELEHRARALEAKVDELTQQQKHDSKKKPKS